MTDQPCPCTKRHSPRLTAHTVDVHHVPPKSWPLALGASRRTVTLCPTCHRLTHEVLNLWLDSDPGEPPASDLRRFNRLAVDLAREAWAKADHDSPVPLPRTLA